MVLLSRKTLLCAAVMANSAFSLSSVPAYFWSSDNLFSNKHYAGSVHSSHDLASSVIPGLLTRDRSLDIVESAETEEVVNLDLVTLLLLPSWRTDLVADTFATSLQQQLNDAATWGVMSHTTRESPLLEELSNTESITAFETLDAATVLASPESAEFLRPASKFLVIRLPTESADKLDSILPQIVSKVSSQRSTGGGDVAFILTGDIATSDNAATAATARMLQDDNNVSSSAVFPNAISCPPGYLVFNGTSSASPYCFSHFVLITPNIVAGLVTGFFFIVSLLIGFCTMHGINTPTRYPSKGPPLGKEY